jgi:hypothetical protein
MTSNEWLLNTTGHSNSWWVAQIQQLIAKHSHASQDPNHDATDADGWTRELTQIVLANLPPGGQYDGNMRVAAVLTHVLLLWSVSLQRAKYSDPRRPVAIRMAAARSLLERQHAIFDILTDYSEDSTYYPGQDFRSPFLPEIESGSFV